MFPRFSGSFKSNIRNNIDLFVIQSIKIHLISRYVVDTLPYHITGHNSTLKYVWYRSLYSFHMKTNYIFMPLSQTCLDAVGKTGLGMQKYLPLTYTGCQAHQPELTSILFLRHQNCSIVRGYSCLRALDPRKTSYSKRI